MDLTSHNYCPYGQELIHLERLFYLRKAKSGMNAFPTKLLANICIGHEVINALYW